MRKDTIQINESDNNAKDEIEFVEKFWTDRWNVLDIKARSRDLINREEYKIILPYLRELTNGARIIDGGCGLGEWTVLLGEEGFDAFGIDISKATCARLTEKFPQNNFKCCDIRNTGFDDNYFDFYLSWGTFEHFEEGLGACFKEAYRVLKPGGHLAVSVPYYSARLREQDKSVKPDNLSCRERFYQWRLSEDELKQEYEKVGFKMLDYKLIHKREGASRYIHSLGIKQGSLLHNIAIRVMCAFLPDEYLSHMIIGLGVK